MDRVSYFETIPKAAKEFNENKYIALEAVMFKKLSVVL